MVASEQPSNKNQFSPEQLLQIIQSIANSKQGNFCETINVHLNSQSISSATATSPIPSTLQPFYDQIQNINKSSQSCFKILLDHKYKNMLCLLGIIYGYLHYQLSAADKLIKQQSSWCNWKQTVQLQHLVSTPYQEVMPQLLQDIQKKYFLAHKQLSSDAFDTFIQDTSHEIAILQQHIKIQSYIKSCYCSQLFYFALDPDMIQEKITRLQWLLDLFATWKTKELLTEHN